MNFVHACDFSLVFTFFLTRAEDNFTRIISASDQNVYLLSKDLECTFTDANADVSQNIRNGCYDTQLFTDIKRFPWIVSKSSRVVYSGFCSFKYLSREL